MRQKSKSEIELLIRRPSSNPGDPKAGFVTKRFAANDVALSVRPRRIPSDRCEVQQQQRGEKETLYVVRNITTDQYLFLNACEYFLWQKMDGDHTLRAIATAYFFEYGSFDFRLIQAFLAKAKEHDLIFMPRTELIRTVQGKAGGASSVVDQLRERLSRLHVRVREVDEFIARWYRRLRVLFNPVTLALHGGLVALGGVAFWWVASRIDVPSAGTLLLSLPILVPAYLLMLFVHELAHALACKHFGREVKALGFKLLSGVVPTVYADVTDIWMSTREARMVVSFAGPFSGLLLGALGAIAAWAAYPGWLAMLFFGFSVLSTLTALFTLYPFFFLELDGYHILTDLLRQPALRERAWRLLRRGLWNKLRAGKKLTREDMSLLAYGLLSVASIAALVAGVLYWVVTEIRS